MPFAHAIKYLFTFIVLASVATGCGKATRYTVDDLPELRDMLENHDPKERMNAAFGIGHIGSEAKAAIPELINALDDREWSVRGAATFALGEIGPEAMEAAPKLLELLSKADDELQGLAIAVRKIHPDADATVPLLIEALDTDRPVARYRLIKALASYGPEAVDALPKLQGLAENDEEEIVREEAKKAIRKIRGD